MPVLTGRAHSGRFAGIVHLRRFLAPLVQRNVPVWEYYEPYRCGTGTIWHLPGIKASRLSGHWDQGSAKDFDDHALIQQHLLNAMQARSRGYFAGRDGRLDPVGENELIW